MNNDQKEINEKIRKLLALASSSNPHEASAAILKAQELMLKHHIDSNAFTEDHEEIVIEAIPVRHVRTEESKIAVLIADNFRTKVFFRGIRLYMIGYRDDVSVASNCIGFVVKKMTEGWRDYHIEHCISILHSQKNLTDVRHSWKSGFVAGLAEAFKQRRSDRSYDLMMITPPKVQKAYDSLNLTSRKHRESFGTDEDSYINGYAKGQNALTVGVLDLSHSYIYN